MENINKYYKFKTYRIQTIFSKLIMFHCCVKCSAFCELFQLKIRRFLFYLGREILITLYVCV